MGEINISNDSGRDAVVAAESIRTRLRVRWVDKQGRQATNVRVLKASVDKDIDALIKKHGGLDKIADLLISEDSEIDFESTGRFLRDTSRVYIDADRRIVHGVQQWEIIRNPDGSERERRPRQMPTANTATETPLKWSGVYIKKEDAARKFVFSGKLQLQHVNGLTYDFLFGMTKQLEQRDSLMLLGAGPKSNQPLILRRGGSQYRGFLEGRTDGDKYCLLLHLSNMELKAPSKDENVEQSQ
jgi:hypothetical protein